MELDTREYMQRRFYYHCFEARELAFLERWLRGGDRLIDIGAHVGLFSLLGARLVGANGRVDAFEPVPATYNRLLRNAALNNYSCLHPQRAAVTDHSGAVSLGIPEDRLVGYSVSDFSIGATLSAVDAPAVTLDEYVDDDIPVRLLKIDAEGSERDILVGAKRLLEDMPPAAILLELNHATLTAHGTSTAEVMSILSDAGYELHTLGRAGRLGPAPSASKVREAANRWEQHETPRSILRIGLATRWLMFNAVAVRADASA
jgi:FkbM family methyltransferase